MTKSGACIAHKVFTLMHTLSRAPTRTSRIGELFNNTGINFIDGPIIGGPPQDYANGEWYKPTIALSGPQTRDVGLDQVFDIAHVGPDIGQASALKMSIASLTKTPNLYACMYMSLTPIGIYRTRHSISWHRSRKWPPRAPFRTDEEA